MCFRKLQPFNTEPSKYLQVEPSSRALSPGSITLRWLQVIQLGPQSSAAEKAAWALYDACLDNPVNRAAVREAGGVPPLVALLAAQREGGGRGGPAASAAWALLQLSSGDDANAGVQP